MIGWRLLQAVAVLALIACAHLALKATPVLGTEWNAARLLYAGSGAVTALTLFALAALGIGQRRLASRLEEIARRQER